MKQQWSLLDPMVDLFEKLRKEWSSQKLLTPQYQGWGISHSLPTNTQDKSNVKSCEQWEYMNVGLQTWHDFQEHLFEPTGAIRSERRQQRWPMSMGLQKSYTRNIIPSNNCGRPVSTGMCINGRQGGNVESRQHQFNLVAEPS